MKVNESTVARFQDDPDGDAMSELRTIAGTHPHILVVNASQKLGALIERYLLISGAHDVRFARSPLDALQVLQDRRQQVDCMVCGYDTAPINGLEFLCALRNGRYGSGPSIRTIPFVLTVVRQNPALQAIARDITGVAVLVHPFDRDMLVSAVKSVLTPRPLVVESKGAAVPAREWSQRYHVDGRPEASGHINRVVSPAPDRQVRFVAQTENRVAEFTTLNLAVGWLKNELRCPG